MWSANTRPLLPHSNSNPEGAMVRQGCEVLVRKAHRDSLDGPQCRGSFEQHNLPTTSVMVPAAAGYGCQ